MKEVSEATRNRIAKYFSQPPPPPPQQPVSYGRDDDVEPAGLEFFTTLDFVLTGVGVFVLIGIAAFVITVLWLVTATLFRGNYE